MEITAQITELGADAQSGKVADVVQGLHPTHAQIDRQGIARTLGALEVHITGDAADGPTVADTARITQIDGHVVTALLAEELPPTDLGEVEIVETPITCNGVIIGLALPVIRRRNLRGHERKSSHGGIAVNGVGTRKGSHGDTAHGERLGVGRREPGDLLRRGHRQAQHEERDGQETFHGKDD